MPIGFESDVLDRSDGRTHFGHGNIPPLAPSETTATVASDYLSYGSYSGADIKVVVHVPHSQVAKKGLEREIADLQNDIQSTTLSLNNLKISPNTNDPENISFREELYSELLFLNEQLADAETRSTDFNNAPTTITLGEVQSISWSIFREKSPVRVLGSVYPRAYTRGPRTIGGSIIFTVFHKHALHELLEQNFKHYSTGTSDYDKQQYTSMLIDQLPPLDISLVFANEYGAVSHMGIYGIDFSQEGGTFSIEDIFSESVVQYTARDLDPMKVVQTAAHTPRGITNEWTKTATQLMADEDTLYGHLKRRNPFI